MKKKTVGTPKRDRARRGVLSKRGTSRSSGVRDRKGKSYEGARVAFGKCYDDAMDQMRKGRSTEMPESLEHSSYGMDDAWSCDILEKLEYIEKVFHFLKVDPAYYKSHLYYLKASVYELLELREANDPH